MDARNRKIAKAGIEFTKTYIGYCETWDKWCKHWKKNKRFDYE